MNLSVTASDSFGHTADLRVDVHLHGRAPGRELRRRHADGADVDGAVNATGASQTCALKVTVSDGHGFTKTATHTETVALGAAHHVGGAGGGPGRRDGDRSSGMSLTGATQRDVQRAGDGDADGGDGHDRCTATVPAGARTGVLSVTTPAGVGPSTTIFKVAAEDHELHAVERGGRERDGRRR